MNVMKTGMHDEDASLYKISGLPREHSTSLVSPTLSPAAFPLGRKSLSLVALRLHRREYLVRHIARVLSCILLSAVQSAPSDQGRMGQL
jgi:hypothetical protein